ncbi:HNH endonuclease signature motif containing protein [Nitratireductor sp. ZSWI3]|uniref:HNH endonuclease signature motif containing protein n=1 Tax=Nitratireductor sp. ZSWI3 TaxID=2966359 RepID=UPI00214F6FAA|nr:HNH endonuclease signature motif containing protein [Nitratireductor sp. ZSWI3]MCR4267088.1 HNH endonuclease [Nitratireductor sp. ZSWI3]
MSNRFYGTANWQRIAARQLARKPICEGCETAPATLADHIVPIRQGGAMRDAANLQSLCRQCHAEKTGAEKAGRSWTPPKHRGAYSDGSPRDPNHPWFTGPPPGER